MYKQAEERKLESEGLLTARYMLAFLKGDRRQMAQLVSATMGKPGTEDLLLAMQADTEGWYGKLKNAHELTRRAMDSAEHNDAKETAARISGSGSAARGGIGKPASRHVPKPMRQLKLAPDRDVRAIAALALGAGRRYGRGGKASGRTRQDLPAGHAGPEVLVAHNPGSRRLEPQRPKPGHRIIEGG